jgi:hypothetical protein
MLKKHKEIARKLESFELKSIFISNFWKLKLITTKLRPGEGLRDPMKIKKDPQTIFSKNTGRDRDDCHGIVKSDDLILTNIQHSNSKPMKL